MAAINLLFANNAQTTIAGSISPSSVVVNLSSGTGALFPNPNPANNEYFVSTFTDAATGVLREIVWCTARTGDSLTIVRAREGTAAQAWAANDLFAELWTAGQAADLVQIPAAQSGIWNFAEDIGATNAYQCALTPSVPTAPTSGFVVRLRADNTNTGASTLDAGFGAVSIRRRDGSALIGNEIVANRISEFIYNATTSQWQIVYPGPATAAAITAGTDTQAYVTPKQLADATVPVSNPTTQVFSTPGAFTYTPTSADVKSIWARFVAAGGGGGGTGGTTGPDGAAGTDTIFNGIHATGGSGGGGNATASGLTPSAGGAGGTGGTGTGLSIPGQKGGVQALSSGNGGGAGGSAPFFGGGAMALTQDTGTNGLDAQPSTGGGGGGSFSPGTTQGAAGGGSGEYREVWLDAPGTTYTGTIGTGGAGGIGTGTGAKTGGAGAGGKVIIVENY